MLKRRNKNRSRKAKKFMLIALGMGILSGIFPIAFFVGGIAISTISIATVFTFSTLVPCFVVPIVGPFIAFHIVFNLMRNNKDTENEDTTSDLQLFEEEEQCEKEKELTEAIRVCLTGWNESIELLKEQQEIEKRLTFEATSLYNEAKSILSHTKKQGQESSVTDRNRDEIHEAKARKILLQRQEIVERKKLVSKLVTEYQKQTSQMEENVQKLSKQWEDMKKSKKQNKQAKVTTSSRTIPIDGNFDIDNADDPLLQKFREQGIDI